MTESTRRPGSSRTLALLLLVGVFVAGLLVGQSGALGPPPTEPARQSASPTSFAVGSPPAGSPPALPLPSVITPEPGLTASQPADAPDDFGLFWEAFNRVRQKFVGRNDLTDEQLTYGAIRGLIDALGDTGHSVFLTPEALAADTQSLGGTVVGIGVLLGERGGGPVIVSVISGGPASRAGLRSGDLILDVDGTDVSRLEPDEVAPQIRGKAGTTVVLTIRRPATGERLEVSMVREQINVSAAGWTMVPGTEIGLLRLIQFSQGAGNELRLARDAAIDAGARGLILDLRSNPGGYVDEAINVASLFISDRTVYISEDANGDRDPVRTNGGITATDLPLVVLIDEGTASSAEIVAGALAAAERGPLVGQKTFGTGTVLETYELADGSAIRLAIQRWLTPDGELIFGRGIVPTVEIELAADEQPLEPDEVRGMTPEQVSQMTDMQLLRAIELLRDRL
jgi:carboxyl-terminal processing protease